MYPLYEKVFTILVKKTLHSNPKSVSDVHKALNDLQLTTSKNEDFFIY